MISVHDLPLVNASLNGTSALLLTAGYHFIRRKDRLAHQRCMIAAFITSTLFLLSYLIYHFHVRPGSVPFRGVGGIRTIYFFILFTHIVLAATILPLALITLSRAWKQRFDRHRRIARWTLPLWLYVSVTGVVIYWMLYEM